jgi:isopropylmalate/homocitrate/citramalate synthase
MLKYCKKSLGTIVERDFVKIVEVGPRDGLQNETKILNTDLKVELINRLVASGISVVEAASCMALILF